MHHVCTECGGSSEEPGVCMTEDCAQKGHELTQCDCTDGKHGIDGEKDTSVLKTDE